MDPFTWISIALMLAGAATSFSASQQSAKAAEDAGKMQRDAAEQQARNEELETAERVKRGQLQKRRRLGRLRAQIGTAGVAFSDSTADVFQETAGMLELETQDEARTGAKKAADQRYQGDLALWDARNKAIQRRISGYGSLLTDATQISNRLDS